MERTAAAMEGESCQLVVPKAKAKAKPKAKPDSTHNEVDPSSSYMRYILSRLTSEQHKKLMEHLSKHPSMASACSGSGMAELVWRAMLAETGHRGTLIFSCENVPVKQEFLRKVVHPRLADYGGKEACLFKDIGELGKGVASCVVHSDNVKEQHRQPGCEVDRHTDIFFAGFSCKDLSRLKKVATVTIY